MNSSFPFGVLRTSRIRGASNGSSRDGLRQMHHGARARARGDGSVLSFRNGQRSGLSAMKSSKRLHSVILNAKFRHRSRCGLSCSCAWPFARELVFCYNLLMKNYISMLFVAGFAMSGLAESVNALCD